MNMQPKSVLKTRKSDFDGILDDDDSMLTDYYEDSSQPTHVESIENNVSFDFH